MEDFKPLIDCIRRETVVLFLGSGFSRKAGAPMAKDITEVLFNGLPLDIQEDYQSNKALDIISEKFEDEFGREALISKLEEIFKFIPTDTSDQKFLTKVPHIHHIVTTNYDSLIEDAYGSDGCYVIRNTDDCSNIPSDKTAIYKIHGDFIAKDNIVLTKQDYAKYFTINRESLFWAHIKSLLLTHDIAFIGYSLEDMNIFSLIEEIRKCAPDSSRKIFLIAPGLKHYKINQLAKTNIIYYDAMAENLFLSLFETLDKKIKSDYQKKRVSSETFSRYCYQHCLQPIIQQSMDGNKVIKFNANGTADVKINLSGIDEHIAEALKNQDSSLYNSFLPNTHIPALLLNTNMITEMNLSINGITVGDREDFKQVWVSPETRTVQTTIRIKTQKFKEKAVFQTYKANKEQICSLLETELYTLKFIFTIVPGQTNCTCNVTFKESIRNINDAIKWMGLIIALWNSEEVIIKGYEKFPLKFPQCNQKELRWFRNIQKYLRNLIEIENIYEVEFDSVNEFSLEAFSISELLVNAYYERPFLENVASKEFTLNITDGLNKNFDMVKNVGQTVSCAVSERPLCKISLNGKDFPLKQKHIIIPACTVIEIIKNENIIHQIRMKITSNYLKVIYSDKDISTFSEFQNFKRIS